MIFDIIFARSAERDLHRLAAADQVRVDDALAHLALTGQGDVRPLVGSPGEYRLRVGGIRVRYGIDRAAGTILIQRILPRGCAYRD